MIGAAVVDRGGRFNFPSAHPLDLSLAEGEALAEADVILALDVYDLGGAPSGIKDRSAAPPRLTPGATIIHITLGDLLQRSWAMDYQRLHSVDIAIAADTSQALPELVRL